MRHDSSAPLTHPLRRGGVCVADGFGVKIFVNQGRLVVEDGIGRNRRRRVYARASHGLARIVMLGREGFITFGALRWLADLGIPLSHLDRDGRILACSTTAGGDGRLRRLQAAAAGTSTGVDLTRRLLKDKLAGQQSLLPTLDADEKTHASFAAATAALQRAGTLDELVYAERDAALAYWKAWATVPVAFARKDVPVVPDYWLRFGMRGSPLTSGPRLAINPANALLNYLYAILEAETRIACLALGLDPELGIVHADYRARNSFALDLLEPARPQVDAYVLDLLRARTFTRRDFAETPRGVCRILAPLSHDLSATGLHWARVVAPIVEAAARQLARSEGSRIRQVAAPLSGDHRSAAQDIRRTTPRRPKRAIAKPESSCRRCGGPLPRRGRVYCDACLPAYQREQYTTAFHGSGLRTIEDRKHNGNDPTHGGKAAERRAKTNIERKAAARQWDERHGKLVDPSAFHRDILPQIRTVPLSQLQRSTGLSLRYVSLIRRGEKTPHPRHWQALIAATEQGAGAVMDDRDTRQEP
jgi:CRISPR-associated protein Cas1